MKVTPEVLRLIRKQWTIDGLEVERVLSVLDWYAERPNGAKARDLLAHMSVTGADEYYHLGYSDAMHDIERAHRSTQLESAAMSCAYRGLNRWGGRLQRFAGKRFENAK